MIPPRIKLGQFRDFGICHLHHAWPRESSEEKSNLFGFILPPFQRDLCWTRQQEIQFIESVWMGLPLGTYAFHKPDWHENGDYVKYSNWLLDGQQRLTALKRYFDGEFKVFDTSFQEVSAALERRFLNVSFPAYEISLWNEGEIKEFYNRMNFGGTAHKVGDRAE